MCLIVVEIRMHTRRYAIFFFVIVALIVSKLNSKKKYAYNTHNTTYIELYIGNISAHITAAYIISGHYIGVIVAVIQAVYGFPAKYDGYMGLV